MTCFCRGGPCCCKVVAAQRLPPTFTTATWFPEWPTNYLYVDPTMSVVDDGMLAGYGGA